MSLNQMVSQRAPVVALLARGLANVEVGAAVFDSMHEPLPQMQTVLPILPGQDRSVSIPDQLARIRKRGSLMMRPPSPSVDQEACTLVDHTRRPFRREPGLRSTLDGAQRFPAKLAFKSIEFHIPKVLFDIESEVRYVVALCVIEDVVMDSFRVRGLLRTGINVLKVIAKGQGVEGFLAFAWLGRFSSTDTYHYASCVKVVGLQLLDRSVSFLGGVVTSPTTVDEDVFVVPFYQLDRVKVCRSCRCGTGDFRNGKVIPFE